MCAVGKKRAADRKQSRGLLFEVEYQAGVRQVRCMLLERRELQETKGVCIAIGDYGRYDAKWDTCWLILSFEPRRTNEA
jgi:hypothetical protein